MTDYPALARYLARARAQPVRMRFAEIEAITGELPPSARRWRTWWANATRNPQAEGWMAVGRTVAEVNVLEDWVRFSAPSVSPTPEATATIVGLRAEPLPVPPGDSPEQREAEVVMLELLGSRLGVVLQPRAVYLPSGARLEVDGACDDPPILCEAWAHQGAAKSAQRDKVAKDILKLLILKEAAAESGAPAPRLILLFGDAEAAKVCRGRSWRAEAVRRFGIEVEVVQLPDETLLAVTKAQIRQFR